MKMCRFCNIIKNDIDFYKNRIVCRICYNKMTKLWYQKNKNHVKEKHHKYYLNNKKVHKERCDNWVKKNLEKRKTKNKIWNMAHPENLRAMRKKYYYKNRLKKIAKTREWMKNNPIKTKINRQNSWRRHRALRLNASGFHTYEEWMNRVDYYGWRCIYCKINLNDKTLTQDHLIPLSRNGTDWPANLAPACSLCNSKKYNKKYLEFIGEKK